VDGYLLEAKWHERESSKLKLFHTSSTKESLFVLDTAIKNDKL
jgi:hypothetical protein